MGFIQRITGSDKDFSEVLKGGGLSLLYRIASMLLSYTLMIFISKSMGERGIGIYNLSLTWAGILVMLGSLGFHTSIVRFVSQYNQDGSTFKVFKIYRSVMTLTLPVSLLLGGAFFMLSDWLAVTIYDDPGLKDAFRIIACILPLAVAGNTNVEFIRGLKEVHVSELFRNLSIHAVNLAVLFLIISLGGNTIFGVDAYAAGVGLSMAYTSYHIWRYSRKRLIDEGTELKGADFSLKEHLLISLPMIITSFAMLLNGKVDTIMLGMYEDMDTEMVGIFTVALKISIITNFVIAALKTIAMPKISELYWSGELDRLKRMVRKSALLIFGFTGPVSIVLMIAASFLLGLVGDGFQSGATTLQIFAVVQMINGACGLVAAFMNMTGDQAYFTRLVLIATLMNILLNAILIPTYGMEGAAIATLVSTAGWNIIGTVRIYKKHGIRTYFDPIRSFGNRTPSR
jgi:O-antigen/teichoic acid export membrane protein